MSVSPRVRFQVSTSLDGRIEEKGVRSIVTTLVLKGSKSDPDLFYSRFWDAWRSRSWEVLSSESFDLKKKSFGSIEGSSGVRTTAAMVRVSGILRREQEMWESTHKSLHDTFQDLNA